MKQSTQLRENR